MSDITKQDIDKISRLARIEIDDKKKEVLTKQLDKIIHWVEKLSEVDTKNVEILGNIHDINLPLFEDAITDGDKTEEILKNAPHSQYSYFTVPKVIE